MERAVLVAGGAGLPDVTWLDRALRSLVQSLAGVPGATLPDVVAARLGADRLELVLAGVQADAPPPWKVDESGTRWSVDRGDELAYDATRRAFHYAPFPTLASVGYTADGEQWMVDLERVTAMSLVGDPERCVSLARFIAAELAHNTWSESLQVTLVGFGSEMARINPDRVSYVADVAAALTHLTSDIRSSAEALADGEGGVLAGRLDNALPDVWAPHVLLIAPGAARDGDGMATLLETMRLQRARTAVAVVIADGQEDGRDVRWQVTVDAEGGLRIPALGLEILAHQIPAAEAAQMAQMLAMAATADDQPIPDADGEEPWDSYADAAGGLRTQVVAREEGDAPPARPRTSSPWGAGATDIPAMLSDPAPWATLSLLPLPTDIYLSQTATTVEDLRALAPMVDEETRRRVEQIDPMLDEDLRAWADPDCPQPRLALLGPVTVIAQGELPDGRPRPLWNNEIVAYLATRPGGVSPEQYGADLWPDDVDINGKTKVRQSLAVVRKWLGTDPRTGAPFVPVNARLGQATRYRVEGVLIDAELFRRLRIRGSAKGPDGIGDLRAALDLVTGIPFSGRRPEGYGWLADNPLDHIYAGMIVDVAHIVATHHLAAGEPALAVTAAQVALRAGSSEDVPLLDLVAACDAQDNRAEADAYVKQILANHDAEVEEDLPPRTAEILYRRQWLSRAS